MVSKTNPVKLTLKPISKQPQNDHANSPSLSFSDNAPEFDAPEMEVTHPDEAEVAQNLVSFSSQNNTEKPVDEVVVEHRNEDAGTQKSEKSDLTDLTNKSNNKFMIDQFICKKLFPRVKFLDRNDPDMEYNVDPLSLCQQACHECHIEGEVSKQIFWENNKKYISQKLCSLRNDRMSELKRQFYGKF